MGITVQKMFVIIAVLLLPAVCGAQESTPTPNGTPRKLTKKQERRMFVAPPEPNKSNAPLNDYVPCLFNEASEIDMRLRQRPDSHVEKEPQPLDEAAALKLYTATTDAIRQFGTGADSNPTFANDFLAEYAHNLDPVQLKGQTALGAYKLITDAAQKAYLKTKSSNDLPRRVDATDEEQREAVKNLVQAATTATNEVIQGASFTKKGPIGPSNAINLYNVARTAVLQQSKTNHYNLDAANDFIDDFAQALGPPQKFGAVTAANAATHVAAAAKDAGDVIISKKRLLPAPRYTKSTDVADQHLIETAASSVLENIKAAANKVVERNTASAFKAPDDVACSMSVLTWQETSDVFGRRVANTYVAIQVTVRNLNNKNEFLIHDIQVAIDTGLYPEEYGRFQAGRDKLLVRGVAQRGRSDDRRNLVLHALEGVGAIAGSSSIAGSSDFKTAVAVFQGAFIPSFSNIFPDHSVEQLNHINDLVFSSSSTSKVLVPIQGSVPLVTFIAEKPVEQLPFAWCGYTKRTGYIHKNKQHCETDDQDDDEMAGNNPVNSALEWDALPFRKWKASALEILQRRTFVVIGGVHIQEVQALPKINNVDCPTLTSGPLDISQAKDGVVSCSITGNSLDKVASINLQKDAEKLSGKIKPAKDGNSAILQFDPAALSDHAGVFTIVLVDGSGKETDSGESILLSIQPVVKQVKESSLDVDQPAVTLEGRHLDQLKEVFLVSEDDNRIQGKIDPPAKPSDTSVIVKFSGKIVPETSYRINYTTAADALKQIFATTIKAGKSQSKNAMTPATAHSSDGGSSKTPTVPNKKRAESNATPRKKQH